MTMTARRGSRATIVWNELLIRLLSLVYSGLVVLTGCTSFLSNKTITEKYRITHTDQLNPIPCLGGTTYLLRL